MLGSLVCSLLAVGTACPVIEFEPTDSYAVRTMHGFTVRISAKASAEPSLLEPAMKLLERNLREIASMVPPRQLSSLRRIAFWVELNNPDFPCACYHADLGWLKQNKYNPDKENSVEIANIKTFVEWINLNQPLMVLHELAHGYHDTVFGFDDPYIAACYKHAMVHKLYDLVDHNRGQKRKAYATTNPMEYFAELTEAWFGANDYFPFTREQLRVHDPVGYELMRRTWSR